MYNHHHTNKLNFAGCKSVKKFSSKKDSPQEIAELQNTIIAVKILPSILVLSNKQGPIQYNGVFFYHFGIKSFLSFWSKNVCGYHGIPKSLVTLKRCLIFLFWLPLVSTAFNVLQPKIKTVTPLSF
uniref:Uncharacterized protein n=1 Tax=Cacopsylla melanoneura TaxID=428564 RepID=A0A8D9AFI2_9HEMI